MTKPTWREEKKLWKLGYQSVAGVDEAGRGAWAGPLVAAAVILPKNFRVSGLNDSKKLSASQRERLFEIIKRQALAWRVSVISVEEIDRYGVGRANIKALQQCAQNLKNKPDFVLVDGFTIDFGTIQSKSIVHGDAKVMSIAAASIVAKVTRDRMMVALHKKYPLYYFHKHKGYGTALHHQAIRRHGLTPLHRVSYKPIKKYVKNIHT
ncbi:MAG: ribonuclease HII [Patescibacteria group bacterium]